MAKTLIIAEKPSVAGDIAKALGGFTRHGEYFESDDYVLSSAVGHLLEIAARRPLARQHLKGFSLQRALYDAHPVRAFGMAGPHVVQQGGWMAYKKGRQNASPGS